MNECVVAQFLLRHGVDQFDLVYWFYRSYWLYGCAAG